MITVLSHTLPCRWALLEYAEGQALTEFDLSIPLNPPIIEKVIAPHHSHLVDKLTKLHREDYRSGVMIDKFTSEVNQPAVVTFSDPETFFSEWGVTASIDSTKEFYAAIVYTGRDNLVRTVYRNADKPLVKTDVHNADGSFSHHEEIYKGELPAELAWAETRLQELKDAGVDAKINHFKNAGANSKVYFRVEASNG
jgi:hypothetical protein